VRYIYIYIYIPNIWHLLQLERSKRWCNGRARQSTWWFSPRNIYKYRPMVGGWGTRGPSSVAVSLTRVIREEGRPNESTYRVTETSLWWDEIQGILFHRRRGELGMAKLIYIYHTWEIIPDEMHFGIIAWPSTILRPAKLWRSWGPALKVFSKCSTRDCLSWVVKNRTSSSLPSKQLASEPTNSLNPPPNSCLRDFGRCTSSAALSRLCADKIIYVAVLNHALHTWFLKVCIFYFIENWIFTR